MLSRRAAIVATVMLGSPGAAFNLDGYCQVELAPTKCGATGWVDVTFYDLSLKMNRALGFALLSFDEAKALVDGPDGEAVETCGFTFRKGHERTLIAIEFRPYVEEFAPFPSTWWIQASDLRKAVLACL